MHRYTLIRPQRLAGSVAEHRRDSLVEVEDAGFVEKHLAPVGEDFFDHFVDRVVQGRGSTTAVRE